MTTKTYQAPSMAEALAEVKNDLGRDAVILHTRSFRTGGLLRLIGGRRMWEVTASPHVNVPPRITRGRYVASPPAPADAAGVWVERGSMNQAGRTHVCRHSADLTTLYVGTSRGGLFKGTLDGEDWEPIGDNLYGGVHWLEAIPAEDPADPDVLVVASDTGLIHWSDDDGESWHEPSGVGTSWGIRRLLLKSDGSDVLFLVTQDWGGTSLLRSTDQGQSFTQIRDLGSYLGDVWTPRDGGSDIYLVDDDQVLRSSDDGESWEPLGSLGVGSGQAELVGSEAGAPPVLQIS